jgi:hypothetical protein
MVEKTGRKMAGDHGKLISILVSIQESYIHVQKKGEVIKRACRKVKRMIEIVEVK